MEFGKVHQLDANLLDTFYQEKILEKLLKSYPYDQPKRFIASALIKTLYLYSSLWSNKSTEGNQIYNLTYIKPSSPFLVLHYLSELFNLCIETFHDRLGLVSTLWNFFTILNWVFFLTTSKYRTLPERLGKVLLPLESPKKALNIDYFYTTRALIFQVLSDTAKIIIPEMQLARILSFFNSEANILAETGEACVVCGEEDMVSPCKFSSCVHSACYFCFTSNCPQCKS